MNPTNKQVHDGDSSRRYKNGKYRKMSAKTQDTEHVTDGLLNRIVNDENLAQKFHSGELWLELYENRKPAPQCRKRLILLLQKTVIHNSPFQALTLDQAFPFGMVRLGTARASPILRTK